MATNVSKNRLNVTELDFDQIRANLKTYLQGQTQFQDYDFEGSGMSVVLDVLAYNTFYNAFNAIFFDDSFTPSRSQLLLISWL